MSSASFKRHYSALGMFLFKMAIETVSPFKLLLFGSLAFSEDGFVIFIRFPPLASWATGLSGPSKAGYYVGSTKYPVLTIDMRILFLHDGIFQEIRIQSHNLLWESRIR